ncbi:hypothetical protein FRC08_008836 [Ceratobasidium sp. 394]|nr:hypothetical protein FRC08_008836 [Ceratobasidium sp. 394]
MMFPLAPDVACTRPQFSVCISTPMDEASMDGGTMRKRASSSRVSANLSFTALDSGSKAGLFPVYPRRESSAGLDGLGQSPTSSPPRSRRGSRAPSPAGRHSTSPHNHRRSCPPSPSASFASLAASQALPTLSRPTYQRTRSRSNTTSPVGPPQPWFVASPPPPGPICIRSRSSSHPHLSTYGSSLLPQSAFARSDRRYSREALANVQTYFSTGHPTGVRVSSSAGPSSPTAPFFSSATPSYLSVRQRRMEVQDSDGEQDPIVFGRQIHHGTTSLGRIRSRTHISRLQERGHVTETETEREGPPRVLPTARGPAHHPPSTTPLMTLLMLSLRLLAIVPAAIGTVIHVHHVVHPPEGTRHTRIDFGVAACWVSASACDFLSSLIGLAERLDGIPVLVPHMRPAPALDRILPTLIHPRPTSRAPSHLLAGDTHHTLRSRRG